VAVHVNVSPLAQKLVDKIKANQNKPKARKAVNFSTPRWNKQEELTWFKKSFPNVDISVLDSLKEVISNGPELWGVFHNAVVYISENAAEGTTYHEAFHVVFNLFTNKQQRVELLKEATSRYKDIKRSKYSSKEDYEIWRK